MAELDSRHITRAKRQVFAQYPELRGTDPEITSRAGSGAGKGRVFVLTFRRQMALPGGGNMTRLVRATVSQDGDILKITSSR